MTRMQRRNHLVAWLVLTPAILAILIGAIMVRADAQSQLLRPAAAATNAGGANGAHP